MLAPYRFPRYWIARTALNRCFGCGQANPISLHYESSLAGDGAVVCLATVP
jgi:hypothetical protein